MSTKSCEKPLQPLDSLLCKYPSKLSRSFSAYTFAWFDFGGSSSSGEAIRTPQKNKDFFQNGEEYTFYLSSVDNIEVPENISLDFTFPDVVRYPLNEEGTQTVHTNTNNNYEDVIVTIPATSSFSDLSIETEEGKAANYLKNLNIIGGFPDGEFKGHYNVNRAEAAKFLLLAKKIEVGNIQNNGLFIDVPEGEWYVKYILKAYRMGILKGYGDGTFRPGDSVNTAEFLKLLTITFNIPVHQSYAYSDVRTSNWFSQYAGAAYTYNLFPERMNGKLLPGKELTRKEVAIAIYRYLQSR